MTQSLPVQLRFSFSQLLSDYSTHYQHRFHNMQNKLLPLLVIGALTFSGCAGNRVIVDTYGVDSAVYQRDMAECKQLAGQVKSNVVGGMIAGALIGAVIGEISNAGNNHRHYRYHRRYRHSPRVHYRHHSDSRVSTAGAAKVGAVSGALMAGASASQQRGDVMRNCMADRGYRILN